jgi:CheY-like chemotaxis protein/HPt (histidine-containing phosphotransfer) domain-containing protein
VGVESEPGRGSRFYLRLPLAVAPETAAVAAVDLPNATVLVVEDTDYNAWAAAAVLSRLGLGWVRARTGDEALSLFGERHFNIVLLDRNLPDLDGTEVARRMRRMEADGQRAVLLGVTAYCTAEDRALCLEAGMDAFVGKPLTPEKLRHALLSTGRRQLATASVQVLPEIPAVRFDLSLLKYISDGTAKGIEATLVRYRETLVAAYANVQLQIRERNYARLAADSHMLAGHSRMIGADQLADVLRQLELAAKESDRATCEAHMSRVDHGIITIMAALDRCRPVSHQA